MIIIGDKWIKHKQRILNWVTLFYSTQTINNLQSK
jgi:hypothetical protein